MVGIATVQGLFELSDARVLVNAFICLHDAAGCMWMYAAGYMEGKIGVYAGVDKVDEQFIIGCATIISCHTTNCDQQIVIGS